MGPGSRLVNGQLIYDLTAIAPGAFKSATFAGEIQLPYATTSVTAFISEAMKLFLFNFFR